jgi:hypothetical protein
MGQIEARGGKCSQPRERNGLAAFLAEPIAAGGHSAQGVPHFRQLGSVTLSLRARLVNLHVGDRSVPCVRNFAREALKGLVRRAIVLVSQVPDELLFATLERGSQLAKKLRVHVTDYAPPRLANREMLPSSARPAADERLPRTGSSSD